MTVLSDEQGEIIRELGVAADIDPDHEIERRTDFLKDYLVASGLRGYVLGVSGGVDSLTAALIAQKAVRELRDSGHKAEFIAVRLPYGVQADEADAERALATIGADRSMVVNIKEPADAMLAAARSGGLAFADAGRQDFILGNIKARQRMIAQFALAGALGSLVIGTDHAAEAVMGFFTKFGDGAADILPLAGLNKRRVRLLAKRLGAPDELVFKVPTADLEDQRPLRPDEEAYGVSYDEIDDFLEGKPVGEIARRRILAAYRATAHKRAPPVAVNAL
ncbi:MULTISPECIES: ammonia-dependent NAD(+) synthetase [unclassified Rhizobium]|uniref:ammonia-dependent NAD(+) synthetase n=1 Tax=unclassified Rhizobium TaxID=2613769 RepID=UPI001C83D60E|nr:MULTISPECIES: ammonia-dependent NAD(+) synthetase [unclassified Rhizobium]MBX5157142.1 ammonia-dependent NAD(+) synthetase [Rhizobium sp. NZLR8]MBX5165099.1 ammonia-dependent NAD(+) synthetase [Rhizobium sp. NZLR4b]MBX5169138.1 ammonia-dependent NAD(+) synthetase [Rhizobium sp. NZLR1b]MBX5189076.1 ammonia-dependent NAD(+) synthetase [Rhizobium sp. NZLR3b]MBX5208809.1 ammonia-dependent NAD(+) synthetase [Rhizobium sp. NZLR11]